MIRISLLLLCLGCVPGLVAQQQVRFPDDFDDALVGSEVVLTNDVYVVSTYGKSLNGTVIVADRVLRAPTDEALPGSADYQSIVAANSASQLSLLASGFDCLDADGTLRVGQSASGRGGQVGQPLHADAHRGSGVCRQRPHGASGAGRGQQPACGEFQHGILSGKPVELGQRLWRVGLSAVRASARQAAGGAAGHGCRRLRAVRGGGGRLHGGLSGGGDERGVRQPPVCLHRFGRR